MRLWRIVICLLSKSNQTFQIDLYMWNVQFVWKSSDLMCTVSSVRTLVAVFWSGIWQFKYQNKYVVLIRNTNSNMYCLHVYFSMFFILKQWTIYVLNYHFRTNWNVKLLFGPSHCTINYKLWHYWIAQYLIRETFFSETTNGINGSVEMIKMEVQHGNPSGCGCCAAEPVQQHKVHARTRALLHTHTLIQYHLHCTIRHIWNRCSWRMCGAFFAF